MDNVFDILTKHIDEARADSASSPFMTFEPWDREQGLDQKYIDMAREDGVDFTSEQIIKQFGDVTQPAPFQSGILTSASRFSITISASQIGKSITELMRLGSIISGEFPYSMRYDKGVDTGIPRAITRENVQRFGRRDAKTGEVIDHEWYADVKRKKPHVIDPASWNCGNIVGAGKFPEGLVAPEGCRIWVGTTRKAYTEMWKPKTSIHNNPNCVFPRHFIDESRGNHGYSAINDMIHFTRGIDLSFITYESGATKFEAARLHRIVFDEEPPAREIFDAAIPRAESIAVITTPYRGITWLKGVMDTKVGDEGYKRIFHCTSFDSPYLNHKNVILDRNLAPAHERAARIWGIPVTQNKATPVFNSLKLNIWMQKFKPEYELGRFEAVKVYDRIVPSAASRLPCLMETDVKLAPASEEDLRYAWRIYETPKKGLPYLIAADVAGGVEDAADAGLGKVSAKDWGAAIIMRPPGEGEKWPKPVAQIRSTLPDIEFARYCLLAARHYNNAVLAPEGARMSGANAAFINEIKDWPYWYMHGTEMWSMRKAQQKKGFDTNTTTRDALFSLIRDWEETWTNDEEPNYVDDCLLDELAAAIFNKRGRPDHPVGGKNDLTIAFGIGLYVFKNCPEQVKCHSDADPDEEESWLDRLKAKPDEWDGFYKWASFR